MGKLGAIGAITIIGVACLVLASGNIALQDVLHAPTPGPTQVALAEAQIQAQKTIEAERAAGGATLAAGALAGIQAEATARAAEDTARAIREAQTAEAFERQAETQAVQMAQTIQASREAAAATASIQETARAWEMQQQAWTATAISENTAATRAAGIAQTTATAEARETASAASLAQANAAGTAEARVTELAFARQSADATATAEARRIDTASRELTSKAWAVLWVVLTAGAAALFGVVIWKLLAHKTEIHVIEPAPSGDLPLIYQDGRITNMDRSPGAVVEIRAPMALPLDAMLQVTAGDQAADRMRAMPRVIQVQAPAPQPALPAQNAQFLVLNPQDQPPAFLLPDVAALQAIDADWSQDVPTQSKPNP